MADGTTFRIASEDDAWLLLKDALDKKIDVGKDPGFIWAGWPYLDIKLPSTPIPGSISPAMMAAFLELQRSIYRTHTLLSTGEASLRGLNKLEKDHLEFRVKVEAGSSLYGIDLQKIIEQFGADILAKMTGTELVVTILGVGLLIAAKVAWSNFLDHRTDQRRIESADAESRARLDSYKAQLDHDTARYEMLTRALSGQQQLKKIDAAVEPARDKVIEGVAEDRGGVIQGIDLPPEIANEVSIRPRQNSADVNIARIYRVAKVDTTVPDGFRVTLHDVNSGEEFSASLLDALVSGRHRELLSDAEWKKLPIKISLKGRRLRGQIIDAKITSVEEPNSK